MTPSSITLGGRRGRHTQRVLKADPSGVAPARSHPTRNERKFISYLTCGGEWKEEGEREGNTSLCPSPIFYPVHRAKRILSFFTSFAASQRAPNSNFAPYCVTNE